MNKDQVKQEILRQIKRLSDDNDGNAPGVRKFISETEIKEHVWLGVFWRNWSEALVEAGFKPNEWQGAIDDETILRKVCDLTTRLGRFPKKVDLSFEARNGHDFPSEQSIRRRWAMSELAKAVVEFAKKNQEHSVVEYAQSYIIKQAVKADSETTKALGEPLGYVYMYRYGTDYKIGRTHSLNKRSRQIQVELPQETTLIHSILTDDPIGIEAYWHKRFDSQRTRGEWFKLAKSDIAAFKRWSKIW